MEDVDGRQLRVFYSPHSLLTTLPKQMPLIVFIHGVGGQIGQFERLLRYFGQVADVLALDLPGCGKSPFTDRRWESYTTEALAELVLHVVERKLQGRKVIVVGHSLGCMMSGRLASKLGETCLAVVLLCPKAEITEKEERGRKLLHLPETVLNVLRKFDRMYVFSQDD